MISSKQALLARTMLDMSQAGLAKTLGWAHQTVSKIEKGTVNPPASRLKELEEFFGNAGVEFLDGDGVRRSYGIRRLTGSEGFKEFFDDIYNTIKKHGGDIFLRNAPDEAFTKWSNAMEFTAAHIERMKELKNYKFRILIEDGDLNTVSSDYAEYRHIPSNLYGSMPIYGYGPKCAVLTLKKNPTIYIFDDHDVVEGFRNEFNQFWKQSKPIE